MKNKTIINIIIISITILNIVTPVAKNWNKFTERFNPLVYERKYNASQYMIPQSKNPISDEELLSYAGYKYITGTNPILINSDHPPLGKYLIGFFTVLTGNNRTVSLFFALVNIILMFAVVNILTRSVFFASLAVLFMSIDPMFVDQIIHSPILDIIQVSFLLSYILILVLWQNNANRFVYVLLMGIILGCLSSIKLYFPAIIVTGVTTLVLILQRCKVKELIRYIATTVPLAFFIYAATYVRYFMESKAFLPFFGVQKWIFLFWQNNSVNKAGVFGNVFPFILINRWYVWWGTKPYISYSGWTFIWPIFFIAGFIASAWGLWSFFHLPLKKRIKIKNHLFLYIWYFVFSLYLAFIPISPRYLMMLYFPIYILITVSLYQFNKYNHETIHT